MCLTVSRHGDKEHPVSFQERSHRMSFFFVLSESQLMVLKPCSDCPSGCSRHGDIPSNRGGDRVTVIWMSTIQSLMLTFPHPLPTDLRPQILYSIACDNGCLERRMTSIKRHQVVCALFRPRRPGIMAVQRSGCTVSFRLELRP